MKNKKEKEPQTLARLAAGAQVRVKPGTTDPDFPDIPLGGWAGKKAKEAAVLKS